MAAVCGYCGTETERGKQPFHRVNCPFVPEPERRIRVALQQIVNVLGPDSICDCPDCSDPNCQGIRVESHEALRIAKEALNVND